MPLGVAPTRQQLRSWRGHPIVAASIRVIAFATPIIAAVAAGLLLHVVTHDLTEDAAHGPLARSLDLIVAALGVAVSLLGVLDSKEPGTLEFVHGLVQLSERTSLVILVALLAAAFALRTPERHSKWARATAPAAVLGAESVLLSVALFGFAAAGLRLLVTTLTVALAVKPLTESAHTEPAGRKHWRARASEALECSGPWLVLGLLIGALLTSVPTSVLQHHRTGTAFEILVVALVANLTPVAAPAAVLIAAGFAGLGLSPGAILLFATLAPIADTLKSALKARVLVSALCLVLSFACDAFGLSAFPLDGALSQGDLGLRAALVLAALLLFGIWQRSARLWLSTIVRPPPHEHEHAHDVHGPHELRGSHELHGSHHHSNEP